MRRRPIMLTWKALQTLGLGSLKTATFMISARPEMSGSVA